MTQRVIVNITALLDRLQHERDWPHYDPPIDPLELWAIVMQLRAFRQLPKHYGGCSNQNALDPIGAWRGVEECGCRRQ
jgi:hypothetical protein